MINRKQSLKINEIENLLKGINEIESNIILNDNTFGKDKELKEMIEDDFYIDDDGTINNNYVSYFYKTPSDRFIDKYVSGLSFVYIEDGFDYLVFEKDSTNISFAVPRLNVGFYIPNIDNKRYKIEFFVEYSPLDDDYIQTRLVEVE